VLGRRLARPGRFPDCTLGCYVIGEDANIPSSTARFFGQGRLTNSRISAWGTAVAATEIFFGSQGWQAWSEPQQRPGQ